MFLNPLFDIFAYEIIELLHADPLLMHLTTECKYVPSHKPLPEFRQVCVCHSGIIVMWMHSSYLIAVESSYSCVGVLGINELRVSTD